MSRLAVLFGVLAVGLASLLSGGDNPPEGSTPLVQGVAVSGILEAEASRRFTVDLDASELFDVGIEQQGVDIELRILDPGGEIVAKVDGPYAERGLERAVIATAAAGLFEVKLTASPTTSGAYEVRAEHRPIGDGDADLLEAARAHAEGDRARQARDPAAAIATYRLAADLWRAAGDLGNAATALHRLGRVQRDHGETAKALDAYLEAASLTREATIRFMTADLLFGAGGLRLELGDLEGAASAYREAGELYSELGDLHRQARAVNEGALAHERQGDLDGARRLYGQALALARKRDDASWQGTFLNNLGEVYLRLGQNELALGVFNEALRFREKAGDRRGEGITLTSLGTAARRLGDFEGARVSLKAAVYRLYGADDPTRMANALVGLGWTELQLGKLAPAERAFTSAQKLLAPSRQRRSQALVLIDLAEVRLAQQDGGRALDLSEEALELFDDLADRQGQVSAYYSIARARRLSGDLETGYRYAALAVQRFESIREQARLDLLRSSYLASRREIYELAVDLAMELAAARPREGWTAKALDWSERSRARSLLDNLYRARLDLPRRFDPELLAREQRAETRLVDLDLQLVRLGDSAASHPEIDREIRRAALELAEVREELRTVDPEAAGLLHPEAFDLEHLKSRLGTETVLLEFFLGAESGFLFWIDGDGVEGYPLSDPDRIPALARLAHENLKESQKQLAAGQARRALGELSELLLSRVAHRLQNQRLVIVPDDGLHYVPFAALPDPRRRDSGSPLVSYHEIVRLPSAAILELLRRPRLPFSKTLAVIADPVVNADDPRLADRQPPGENKDDETLRRLPFTEDEARAILALVPEDQRLGALGFDASLDLVESGALEGYRIVHFAVHGRLHSEHAELSGLELSRFDAAGKPRAGTLYVHRVYDLPLNAELIVLSACRTALGHDVRGEGLVGLTHGFFHAGASGVLVSLWGVDDEATTELMTTFYRGLFEHRLSPATALRAAQQWLRADPRWRSPYYWAAFVLQGDWG